MRDENEFDITDLDPDLVLVDAKTPRREAKLRRRHREWNGVLIGLMAAIAGLVAGRLGHIWPLFDVFSQFGMQFMIMTGAFVIGIALPRLKSMFALMLTVLGIAAYGSWPHWTASHAAVDQLALLDGEKAVKIATYNSFHDNVDYDSIAREVERIGADVVTMIEFTPDKAVLLDKLRLVYPFQFSCHAERFCHLAILSKYPLDSPEGRGIWVGAPYIKARIPALGGLSVIGVHTTRFPHSRAQLAQVTGLIDQLETDRSRVIMMGDFNATPFSRITTTIEQGLGLVRHTSQPTWPANYGLPQLAIDHIFTSGNIRALSDPVIGNAAGSDHFPVSMTVAVPLN